MKEHLDKSSKKRVIQMLISHFYSKSLFEAEETNAEGFAKECAVVTHYRLKMIQTIKETNS